MSYHSVPFDTMAFSKSLREGDFSQKQADALASNLLQVVDNNLATKDDIKALSNAIDTKGELVRRDIKIWVGGVAATAITILGGLLIFFHH